MSSRAAGTAHRDYQWLPGDIRSASSGIANLGVTFRVRGRFQRRGTRRGNTWQPHGLRPPAPWTKAAWIHVAPATTCVGDDIAVALTMTPDHTRRSPKEVTPAGLYATC
jgi:hypothetical protein